MFLYQLIRLWPLSKFLRKIVLQPRLLQFRLQLTHHQPEAYLCSLYGRRDFGIFQDIPFLQFMLAGATVKELGKSLLRRRHWLRVRNLLGYPSKYSKGRWGVESKGGRVRERMCCSTSSSGLGRMESFADNSSSRRLRSNSACQSVSMSWERRGGMPVRLGGRGRRCLF